jgi:hypothetical protein
VVEQDAVSPGRVPLDADFIVCARGALVSGRKQDSAFLEACDSPGFKFKNQLVVEQQVVVHISVDCRDHRSETAINPVVQITNQDHAVIPHLLWLNLV